MRGKNSPARNLEIRNLATSDRDRWRDFVLHESDNGTLIQTPEFYSHDERNQADHLIVFEKNSEWIALLVGSIEGKTFASHPRNTFGGFVFAKKANLSDRFRILSIFHKTLIEKNLQKIKLTLPFLACSSTKDQSLQHVLWRFNYQLVRTDLEMNIDLNSEDSTLNMLSSKARNQFRKGNRSNFSVRPSEDWSGFWPILEQNLESRHNSHPTHDLAQFLRLKKALPENSVQLLGLYLEHQIVGGFVAMAFTKNLIHARYIAVDSRYFDKCASHFLIVRVMDWAKQNQFHYLNLGMANENQGTIANMGLFHFKEGFGATGLLRETYEVELSKVTDQIDFTGQFW